MYMLFKKIELKKRLPIIIQKIENQIKMVSNIHNANPKANYLNSIRQNISTDVLKKYLDLYTNLVIKVKDIHHRGCMNHFSSETNTILFYELCQVIKSSFNIFCKEDAEDIDSVLLGKQCNPNAQFSKSEQNRMSEEKKKLTERHISFIPIQDIFVAVLLHYCDCKTREHSDKIQYMLEYLLPNIESVLSIYLHSMISYSNMECQGGGKRSNTQKQRRYKKKTRKLYK